MAKKQKFKSAEAAASARKNQENWQKLLEKYDVKNVVSKSRQTRSSNCVNMDRSGSNWRDRVDSSRLTDHIQSLDTGVGDTAQQDIKVYTGDEMIGIGQLHKSNAIPIFKQEDAKDLANMRR